MIGYWTIDINKYLTNELTDDEKKTVTDYYKELSKEAATIIENVAPENYFESTAKLIGIESKCRIIFLIYCHSSFNGRINDFDELPESEYIQYHKELCKDLELPVPNLSLVSNIA